jgi:Protein of unknown function (DUF3040)
VALSMDEQHILEEMERRLADDDPALAARLTSFGRQRRVAAALRSARVRLLLAVLALAAIAAVSILVYVLSPFRADGARGQLLRPGRPDVTQSLPTPPGPASAAPPGGLVHR